MSFIARLMSKLSSIVDDALAAPPDPVDFDVAQRVIDPEFLRITNAARRPDAQVTAADIDHDTADAWEEVFMERPWPRDSAGKMITPALVDRALIAALESDAAQLMAGRLVDINLLDDVANLCRDTLRATWDHDFTVHVGIVGPGKVLAWAEPNPRPDNWPRYAANKDQSAVINRE